MVSTKCILLLISFYTILALALAQVTQGGTQVSQGGSHVSQGKPHESQGRVRRAVEDQSEQTGQHQDQNGESTNKISCDFNGIPTVSCHDCYTKLICKPIGGILKSCQNPKKPYCNNGICSSTPSTGCGV